MTRPQSHSKIGILLLIGVSVALAIAGYKIGGRDSNLESPTRLASLPPMILWAWERPERLSYLDPKKVTVAFLAQTIYLGNNRVVVRPRMQPLELPANAPIIAVTRIESDRNQTPTFTESQVEEAARAIADVSHLPGVVDVQVDYDATVSERVFYSKLLLEVRKQLPASTALTITALASWCQGDDWLDDLPIDEAVPMLFRMGLERNQFLSKLAGGEPFRSPKCRMSAGVSTDETLPELPATERVYVFNPTSWSKEAVADLFKKK